MLAAPHDPFRIRAVSAQSPISPSFRVRVLQLREELARHGVAVIPEPLFSAEEERRFRQVGFVARVRLVARSRRRLASRLRADQEIGATLVQRQVDMVPSLSLERVARDRGRLVLDVDDAIWLDTAPEARLHPLAVLKGTRRKIRWLARGADHVIAGNRILAEWLSDYADRVTVVPSVVDTRQISPRQHRDEQRITLGWIGSASTSRYLEPLEGVLHRVRRAVPDRPLRLLLVGGEMKQVEGVEIDARVWSPEGERQALAETDIGLMPLPDTPWTRGKCAYKALQYMASGVPAVADDVGVAAEVIGPGGRTVKTEDEWVEALVELGREVGLRERIGQMARRRVEESYSVERWAPVLADVLKGGS